MNVVIKVNDEIKEKMIEYYKDKRRDKVIPYVVFKAKEEDTVITMYESGKVMFQGTSADVDAAMWGVALENTKEKNNREDQSPPTRSSSSGWYRVSCTRPRRSSRRAPPMRGMDSATPSRSSGPGHTSPCWGWRRVPPTEPCHSA